MTKRQKTILAYSTLTFFLIGIVVSVSVLLFGDIKIDGKYDKEAITTSLITYSSAALLFAKIVSFIASEVYKHKKLKPSQHLHKIINDGENKMNKDRKISKEYLIQGFKFVVNEKKGISITFDKVEIMGSEDFYNKLNAANSEFLEQIRKTLQE